MTEHTIDILMEPPISTYCKGIPNAMMRRPGALFMGQPPLPRHPTEDNPNFFRVQHLSPTRNESTPNMSLASKAFFGFSMLFTGATIFGVHWMQQQESNVSMRPTSRCLNVKLRTGAAALGWLCRLGLKLGL